MKLGLRGDQRGHAMVLVLAFMALAAPVVLGALGLVSTLSMDAAVKTRDTKSIYGTMAGLQHAMYCLRHELDFASSVATGVPSTYVLTLNGWPVTVTVTRTSQPNLQSPAPAGTPNRSFSIAKNVGPSSVLPNTPTVFLYSVILSNVTEDVKTISDLRDAIPPGVTYVPGSTTGLTTTDPTVVAGDLRWGLSSIEGTLAPFSSKTLEFSVQGSLAEGVYCNDIWVTPGGDKTRSGPTAKIIAGFPASASCTGNCSYGASFVTVQS